MVIALEGLVVFTWRANPVVAVIVASVIIEPFFVTIVTAFSYADLRDDLPARAVWLRVLERSWAVLLIGLFVNLIVALGYQTISLSDFLDRLLGAGVIIIAISLIFADVHATVVDDAEPWWLLVPRSFGASMATAWRGIAFARALIVFMFVALLPQFVEILAQTALEARHIPRALFWANAVSVLLLPLVQALCTFVYLDAIGYESKRPCGR